jgi:hypothetical protein
MMNPQTATQGNEARRAGPLDEAHTTRSRRSMLEEVRLRATIKKIHVASEISKRRIREAEEQVQRLTRSVVLEGQEALRYNLVESAKELAAQRDILKACESERASAEAAIAALAPTLRQVQGRQEEQGQLAHLAEERMGKDRRADSLLKELRKVLQERSQLTAVMAESQAALDGEAPADGLDESRFKALLGSLPEDLLSASERWYAWFFGKRKDVKPYVVRVEWLQVRESLFDHGFYRFGERILLNDDEARDFLCNDYYAPNDNAPWACEPARVMTVEAFEDAARKASESGISVRDVYVAADRELDEQEKKFFSGNMFHRRTTHKRAAPAEDNFLSASAKVG